MDMRAEKRALDKIYKRRDRYEIPDWQREEVWSRTKKQALIDSILRNWKLPKFYFVKTASDPNEYEVVDGQQRLLAIFDFFDNELSLSEETAAKVGASYYNDLPEAVADGIDDYEIEFDEITNANDEELKEFFQRLQEGLPLTSSEKLNSVHSKLRDFCRKLSKHEFFDKKVVASDKRYGHFDIVAKVAVIEIEGIDTGLRFDDLKAAFKSQENFSSRSNVAKRLRDTFDYLNRVFPKSSPILKNRTIVQSFATLTALILQTGNSKGTEARVRKFFEFFGAELSRKLPSASRRPIQSTWSFRRLLMPMFEEVLRSGTRYYFASCSSSTHELQTYLVSDLLPKVQLTKLLQTLVNAFVPLCSR